MKGGNTLVKYICKVRVYRWRTRVDRNKVDQGNPNPFRWSYVWEMPKKKKEYHSAPLKQHCKRRAEVPF